MFVGMDVDLNLRDCREAVGVSSTFVRTQVGQPDWLYHCLDGQDVYFPGGVAIPKTPLHYFQKRYSFETSVIPSALCISCRLFAVFCLVLHFPASS